MRAAAYRAIDFAGTHATRLLGAGVLVGLALPPLATALRPLLLPAIMISLVLALVRLDWRAFGADARRPLLVAAMLVWFLGASPAIVWLALGTLPLPAPVVTGLVLVTAAAPIMSGAAISLLVGLDAALAVVAIVTTTALVPLTLPPLAAALLGVALEVDLGTFMLRLASIVGGAFAAAWLTRRVVAEATIARHARALDGVTVIWMVVFAIGIMDGVAALALERPGYVVGATAAAFAANLLLQAVGAVTWLRQGRQRALTLGLLTGNRNMGLVLVALGAQASPELVAFFAVAQIPMYVLPGLLLPVYRRLVAGQSAQRPPARLS
jgi:BASS family bile acid:Na+ symporter